MNALHSLNYHKAIMVGLLATWDWTGFKIVKIPIAHMLYNFDNMRYDIRFDSHWHCVCQ